MKISVVIPNYNYTRFVAQAVRSARDQTHRPHQIIVVDDGSTDNSIAVLRALEAECGGILQVIEQPNQGVSRARNRGIEAATGDLVGFLDADDYWHPEKLARQLALLSKPAVGLVHTGISTVDVDGRPLGVDLSGMRGNILRTHALLRGTTILAGASTALVRRECFDRLGAFEPALSTSADWDMWRRIGCHYDVEHAREPLVSYRLHGGAMHRNLDLFEHDMLLAFERMFADPAARSVYPLKAQCYLNLHLTLAASNLQARRFGKAFSFAARGLRGDPAAVLTYLAGLPLRRIRRRLHHEDWKAGLS